MNISFFGKIIAGLGIALLLIGIVSTISSLPPKYSYDDYVDLTKRGAFLATLKHHHSVIMICISEASQWSAIGKSLVLTAISARVDVR